MENAVLRDILLVITVLAAFVFGFFVMKRLDKFLNENYKPHFREKEEKPTRIVHNESTSDEQIISDIKRAKKKSGKVKIIILSEDDCYDE